MKKIIATIALVATTAPAFAGDWNNGALPQAGYDRVRTSTGAECQTSLDTGRYFNTGVYAVMMIQLQQQTATALVYMLT